MRFSMLLSEALTGDKISIVRIGEADFKTRKRLCDFGLLPKTRVTLLSRLPNGGPLEIRLRGFNLTVRSEIAEHIEVKKQ